MTCEVLDLPESVEPLVDYFRAISGEHPDWDEYRQAMRDQGKSLLRHHPDPLGSRRDRRLPGPAGRLRPVPTVPPVAAVPLSLLRVGVTGGIGSGKSTVAQRLSSHGAHRHRR